MTFAAIANAPQSATGSGRRTAGIRRTSTASSAAAPTAAATPTAGTPTAAIRYGVSALYETGCTPPYQPKS